MTPDPKRVEAVFGVAIQQGSGDERAAALDRECCDDAALRGRVEALLAAHERNDTLLQRPFVRRPGVTFAPNETREPGGEEPEDAGFVLDLGWEQEQGFDECAGSPFVNAVEADEATQRSGPKIHGYEILEELGRGGMGVVYRGRQIQLDRACALKMILGGRHASAQTAARFFGEARAIAQLRHPNIVQIHHIGEADGLPFFELEYVDGGSLDSQLEGTPWSARRGAELFKLLAEAVAEAHRLGIVHRDLKPGNILLMGDGTPKITDFGLAKSLGSDSNLTATDSIMGSPSYMAPEQAGGQSALVGKATDVYALGATLYEILTGRPPFRGPTVLDTLDQVKCAEPVPPSRLVPGLPPDLETIVLKCLQKEPVRRYESAFALAADLKRFLAGTPILARPVPLWERAWQLCRLHPTPAALTALVVLVSALGVCGIIWQWNEAVRARDLASLRARAESAARIESERTLVDMYTTSGIRAGADGNDAEASLWFANASRKAKADPDRRDANAIRAMAWGRKAFAPRQALRAEGNWPVGLRYHPSGRYLLSSHVFDGANHRASWLLSDIETERAVTFSRTDSRDTAVAWSADESRIAMGQAEGDVLVAQFPTDPTPVRVRMPPTVRALVFSDDGHFLAIGAENIARIWDVRRGTFLTRELRHPDRVLALAFDPTGRYLATGCLDQKARVFEVSADKELPVSPPVPHIQPTPLGPWEPSVKVPPRFVEGGSVLLTHGGERSLRWQSVATGEELHTLEFPEWNRGLAFTQISPDGEYLAAFGAQGTAVRLVDMQKREIISTAIGHKNSVYCVAFSQDSRFLISGSSDNTARIWSVPDGAPIGPKLELHRPVIAAAFAPDGKSVATQDGSLIRTWGLPEEAVPLKRVPIEGNKSLVKLNSDGTLAVATGMTFPPQTLRVTQVLDLKSGQPTGALLSTNGFLVDAAFSPDDLTLATASIDAPNKDATAAIVCWDWRTGVERWRTLLGARPRSVSFRNDGRRLCVLCEDGELLVLDVKKGNEILRWKAHAAENADHWITNGKAMFSPDDRSIVTWGMGNDAKVWDAEAGQLRYPAIAHKDKCHDVQFSPDGRLMVLAAYDGSVEVRSLENGSIVAALPSHPDIVYSARFDGSGNQLVTACRDATVRVWEWKTGRLVCPPFEHDKEVMAAAFSRDGWIVSVSDDNTARVWDPRIGKPLTPPLPMRGSPMCLQISQDGRYAVMSGFMQTVAVLGLEDLSPRSVDTGALTQWTELLSGRQFHDAGGTVNLSADEWLDRWRNFRRAHPVARDTTPASTRP
jgi:WD40 repeat protein/predicted Ser/Thr protein kinase